MLSALNSKSGFSKLPVTVGFTLVELLVVIGIIGLLAGIMLPALLSSKNKAREISCVSNLKQIGLANILYESTYKRLCPFRNGTTASGAPWNSGQWWFGYRTDNTQNWDVSKGLLVPYLDRKGKTITCPQAELLPIDGATGMNGGVGGYGYNSYGVGSTAYFDGYGSSGGLDSSTCWDNGGVKSTQIKSPTETVMFADAANLKWGTTDTLEEKAELTTPYSLWDVAVDKLKCKKPAGSKMYGTMHFRHPGKTANIVWVDGHVDGKQLSFSWGRHRRCQQKGAWLGHVRSPGQFQNGSLGRWRAGDSALIDRLAFSSCRCASSLLGGLHELFRCRKDA
ncbi:MAG: DUF1559 domain-containing protein [Kiritimatiellaeota bacterium]|nr:DUF1559 domain-containing protein [Kiritimatiellota bacterium]